MSPNSLINQRNVRIELFSFSRNDTFSGSSQRHAEKARLNEFLKEHDGYIIDIQFTGKDAMVIYTV